MRIVDQRGPGIWSERGCLLKIKSFIFFIVFFCTLPMAAQAKDFYRSRREGMVEKQIKARGIRDERVLKVLSKVPRHLFVPPDYRSQAYGDYPLPIGYNQTISQPYIVALMTELLRPDSNKKILEIGTGSGYQAAVLAKLVEQVYTIEIVKELAESSKMLLQNMGYDNVKVKEGDGYGGWPEYAPFDGIIVTAAPPQIPSPLVDQLKVGGIMVVPVGDFFQNLLVLEKTEDGMKRRNVIPVRFVPMTGKAQHVD